MFCFFFNDTATTEIYTLSLHDALPIYIFVMGMEMILKLSQIGVFCLLCPVVAKNGSAIIGSLAMVLFVAYLCYVDRKSTRLNSSHANISYAVFCLKKKLTST